MPFAEELTLAWRSRLQTECADQPPAVRESIVRWLVGEDADRLEEMEPEQQAIARQAMDYRYRILKQRYLGIGPEQAHRKLIQRLGSLFLIRSKIRTWVSLSRDRQRSVMDVLQEVIQELIQNDRYIRQQIHWIAKCTTNPRLRNALILTTVEEYCLRPIRNQPLLVFRFVNYLRRIQRAGMTQVPTGDLIRLVSEEVVPDDAENPVSLLDSEAITQYQDNQFYEEQQSMRTTVKQEFMTYLEREVDPMAAQWLQLHLQGQTQETIAKTLNRPIKEVYRLREKISYHAIRVFAVKSKPDLVMNWLGTSLEQNFGLSTTQWETFWEQLSPVQRSILEKMKAGEDFEAIAKDLNLKTNQVVSEWSKIYLAAQTFRSG